MICIECLTEEYNIIVYRSHSKIYIFIGLWLTLIGSIDHFDWSSIDFDWTSIGSASIELDRFDWKLNSIGFDWHPLDKKEKFTIPEDS